MKKGNYRRIPRKSFALWLKEKQEAERAQRERNRRQREHDERLQMLMTYKEEAEDLLSDRIFRRDGQDVYQMDKGDKNLMKVWEILSWYPDLVAELQRHIPNLEHDPRITPELPVRPFTKFDRHV